MKFAILTGTFLCAASAWWCLQAGDAPDAASAVVQQVEKEPPGKQRQQKKLLSDFMRKKLNASNQILEGLVTDDLAMVSKACDTMLEISTADRWRASNDMMYLQHSEEFRNSVKHLRTKANSESIDGTALAWVDVTMNCIQCHEWVRNVMVADIPPLSDLQRDVSGD